MRRRSARWLALVAAVGPLFLAPPTLVAAGALPPAIAPAPAADPGDVTATLVASGSFQLAVPFRSQRDGDRFQGSNCGPASLGMVLQAFGVLEGTSDLRLRSHTYQRTVGMRTGTALQYVAMAGADFGLDPAGLYDGAAFHRWTIDDVRSELEVGHPVIPLVKYRLLPGHEASTIRFDHYIVIYGIDGDRFLYNDPAYASEWEGEARWILASQLETAMAAAIVPRQAVAFDPGTRVALAVAPLEMQQA